MPLRTVYLGTSDFAATILEALAASAYRPVLVVTPPDRRQGRGRQTAAPPAAVAARRAGVDLLQTEDVSAPEAMRRLHACDADLGVVCAFGQILRAPLLDELELLNVHPSLLPRWRGAAPIERALMAGDPETGVTIMRVTESLDAGPIALQKRISVRRVDDFGSLSERLATLSGELAVKALERRAEGTLEFVRQDEARATYAEKISASDRRLDPTRPAPELERRVRALTPHIGAYLNLSPEARLGVRRAVAGPEGPEPGAFAEADGELLLGCGEGSLRLRSVQPPGGRPMTADAYLRGHGVPERAL